MCGRLAILGLAALLGCAGDAPDPDPLDSALLGGALSAEFDGEPFEVAHGLLYGGGDGAPGRLLLSTDALPCPYADHHDIVGIHASVPVTSVEPGSSETQPHDFWKVTEESTQDYGYPDGQVEVTGASVESFSGEVTLGGAEATLEGTFEVARCPG